MRRILPGLFVMAGVAVMADSATAQNRNRDVPYTTSAVVTLTNVNTSSVFAPNPIPANKRLVIEFVSITISGGQAGDYPAVFLQDLVNGAGTFYWILPTQSGPGEYYRASQALKLYVDGSGTEGPVIGCAKANLLGNLSCGVNLSGYLTDK